MNTECHEMPSIMAAPSSPDYLAQLLKDRKQMQSFSSVFIHLGRILEEEICRVRENIFQQQIISKEPLELPEPFDQIVTMSEKLYIPVKEHPDFNFVGRILGPRGMTTKQIEQITGCKVMIRGKGSMRDRKKEELNRGKPNWEHLNEDLHVLITVEDTQNRATIRLQRAVNELRKLLVPLPEGEDDLKKLQLMELAIMNGTYRDNNGFQLVAAHNPFIMATHPFPVSACTQMALPPLIRASVAGRPPGPAGAPIILAPRIPVHQLAPGTMSPIGTSTMQPQPSTPALPPQLVPVADITSPPPYLVHFDPYMHQTASLEHMPPNVTYVR